MRKVLIRCTLSLVLISGILVGCEKKDNQDNINSNKTLDMKEDNKIIPTITAEELKSLYEENPKIIIIDLRTKEEYQKGHIQGAVQIDIEDLKGLVAQGLQNKEVQIVIYSNSRKKSQEGVDILESLTYKNVKNLGSINDWQYDFIEGEK
jgi:Rhodanese-related sulfurtransferase